MFSLFMLHIFNNKCFQKINSSRQETSHACKKICVTLQMVLLYWIYIFFSQTMKLTLHTYNDNNKENNKDNDLSKVNKKFFLK